MNREERKKVREEVISLYEPPPSSSALLRTQELYSYELINGRLSGSIHYQHVYTALKAVCDIQSINRAPNNYLLCEDIEE